MICMGLEGRSPGESRGLCLADAVFRRLGKKDELQSRMRLVYSRNGDMGKRSQGWGVFDEGTQLLSGFLARA
jgi:hypothetical protein